MSEFPITPIIPDYRRADERSDAAVEFDLGKLKADLTWRFKVTSGTRFNASKRLNSRDAKITVLNAVSSVSVIFLTVFTTAVHSGETVGIVLVLFTILASIAILVTSLFQYALKDAVNAERMHVCALKLSALRYKILYSEVQSRNEILAFAAEYDSILSQFPNHDEADYQRYRDEHPEEFDNMPTRGLGPGGLESQKVISTLIVIATVGIAAGVVSSIVWALIERGTAWIGVLH